MGNKNTEKVYEVSFHLVPTLDADGVSKAFARVKDAISGVGKVISEESPVLRDLAYTIRHTVRQRDGSYDRFDEAHFGSVKFSSPRGGVKRVEQSLSDDDEVLRFLVLETVAEDTRIGEVLPGDEVEEEEADSDAAGDATDDSKDEQKEGESGVAEQPDEGDAV